MRLVSLITAILVISLSTGCIPLSLQGIHTKQNIVFEPGLIGKWSEAGSSERYRFFKAGDDHYYLLHKDEKGREGEFEVYLVDLDGVLFMDLFPEKLENQQSDFYNMHLWPVHSFVLVEEITPALKLRMMEHGWLEHILETNPGVIDHRWAGEDPVLTASAEELQEFLLKHIQTEGAYTEVTVMTRK